MKRIIHIVCLVFLSVWLVSCSGEKPVSDKKSTAASASRSSTPASQATAQPGKKSGAFRTITPRDAQQLIAVKKDILIVDVRNAQELREGFIAGSSLVPFWKIAKGQASLPSDRPLLLVCAVGGRSYAVGQFLNRNGYPEVYNLQGGISAWKKEGLPLQYK